VKLQYFTLFDGANSSVSTEQRSSSLTPLQSLYFLNGAFPQRCASQLANNLLKDAPTDNDRISQAFQIIYGRSPSAAESARSITFLRNATGVYALNGDKQDSQLALTEFLKAMFASNEFMFIE
jgi:hypothetical protein